MKTGTVTKWLLALALVLTFCGAGTVHAQSAGTWTKRAANAEAREDYDTAYEDYKKAFEKDPKDLRNKTNYERVRFVAAATHVDKGRALRKAGDTNAALTEYLRALQIDPGNQAAAQEIESIRQLMSSPGTAPVSAPQPADSLHRLNTTAGPVMLKPISAEPLTLKMTADVKDVYLAIGKAAGINVLFDNELAAKRVPVELSNTDLYDALRIVGTISGTFWKPVTANTIFVAQNTPQKHTDLDEQAVQTFYLSNASQQSDLNDVNTVLRQTLDSKARTMMVAGQNAIVVRATPDELVLAQKLIADMDRAKPEVVVDVAVMEVNRDKLRTIGLSLPQSFGLTLQTPNASSSTSSTSSTSTSTSSTSSSSTGLSLSNLGGLNSSNFAVSVGTATANMLLTDSDTKVLQNPSIRASDGQKASLKIGSRIPIATGSYSSGVATTAVSSLVSTQFTYIDVGVNIDMTPTVHYDHDVTLKMKVEVSSESGTETISGITEPIIAQDSDDTVIRLKEGESTILASLVTKNMTKSVSGTPFLGEIPILKYLFSSQSKQDDNDEVVFLLTPHVVREQMLTPLNTRPIDTGTANDIALRFEPASADSAATLQPAAVVRPAGPAPYQTSANNMVMAANAVQQQSNNLMQPPAVPGQPPPNPVITPPATAGPPVVFSITPSDGKFAVGSTFQVTVKAAGGHDLLAIPLDFGFDATRLQMVDVVAGDLLSQGNQVVAIAHRDDGNGNVTMSLSRPPRAPGITANGNVCVLTFKAIAAGDATIRLKRAAPHTAQGLLPAITSSAVVHLQ